MRTKERRRYCLFYCFMTFLWSRVLIRRRTEVIHNGFEIFFERVLWFSYSYQGMFLEWWKRTKSLSSIWQHFSCLRDMGIQKMWKRLNSHGVFLRADQGRAKICCQMGWIGCALLQVAQKAILRIQFLAYFWNLNLNLKSLCSCWT